MTAKHLIAELQKLDPNTMIARSTRSGKVRLVTSLDAGGIFFDGGIPHRLRGQAARAPRGLSSYAPEIVVLNSHDPHSVSSVRVDEEDDDGEVDEHLLVGKE